MNPLEDLSVVFIKYKHIHNCSERIYMQRESRLKFGYFSLHFAYNNKKVRGK